MTGWSAAAREAAGERWEAQHRHPVVRGIAEGTLPVERLERWVRQDYVFLVDYARVLALGAARAPDLATMAGFADVARSTLHEEMALHRSYAAEFGISEEALEAEPASVATAGYVDFLLRHAAGGDFEDLVAVLLPCMWGFSEIGARLVTEGAAPSDERFRRWIAMYGDPEFAALAQWCRDVADRAAAGVAEERRARMTTLFVRSVEHELAFWDQVL